MSESCACIRAFRSPRPISSRRTGSRRYARRARRLSSRCTSIMRASSRPPPKAAITRLKSAGAKLLSQTVLLKGVNDDAATLRRALARARGAGRRALLSAPSRSREGHGHFRLSLARGREIYEELARLRGGAPLPRYVLDLPGGFGKIPIEAPHLTQSEDGSWRARDRFGVEHRYEECFDGSREAGTPQGPAGETTIFARE